MDSYFIVMRCVFFINSEVKLIKHSAKCYTPSFFLSMYLLYIYYQNNMKANWRKSNTVKGRGLNPGFLECKVAGQMKGSGDGHGGGEEAQ